MEKIRVKGTGEIVEIMGLKWSKVEILDGAYKGREGWFYSGGYDWLDEGEIVEFNSEDEMLRAVMLEEPDWEYIRSEIADAENPDFITDDDEEE